MSAQREMDSSERLRACGAFAGGAPSVPANLLNGFLSLDGGLEVPVIDFCFVFKADDAVFLIRVEDVF